MDSCMDRWMDGWMDGARTLHLASYLSICLSSVCILYCGCWMQCGRLRTALHCTALDWTGR
ncbi:hypothetical protein BO71DRAFT_253682 [Aspergillus ellipticus CBS 707.79]|uniref:Uncharacterized protein n=1 Tax=Aspergillus ellipticus CBS 707.79 TaxID=1448320 RepID=A0A319D8B1_9EURO|nr:hypothetical protein BO71DRAFT_253682 [Aspergillus ellipticus CBS 707.79]